MKKFLLLLSIATLMLSLNAQKALKDTKMQKLFGDRSDVILPNQNLLAPPHGHHNSGVRSAAPILNSHRIGTAGNLLTIISGTCNQLDVNDSLNSVVFIHRNNPSLNPQTNVAQYRFDISKDRGMNWTTEIGPITNDAQIDNISVNGRFPQAVIFNPAGNTNVDSAYLIYSGTWHNSPPTGGSGSWQGHMKGRGKLSGDISTFNVEFPQLNGGHVAIAAGFTQGQPGTVWNVNEDYSGTFVTGAPAITSGFIVEKGVWNSSTKNVDWTHQIVPQVFTEFDNAGTTVSVATSFNIAFDPTGQYGWVACLGDITPSYDSVYTPIFWRSTNYGASWTGPYEINLDSLPGVLEQLDPLQLDGTPASGNPTTAFQNDLTVDVNGVPHLLTVIGNASDPNVTDPYAVEPTRYSVWDITYNPNAVTGCEAQGYKLADIYTFRGTFDNENPAQTEDNRPLVSRSPDGHKIFFFWNESDHVFVGGNDNSIPNLYGRAIDVVDGTITQLYNFTEGDSLWGGETQTTTGGLFGGANYPDVSPTCLVNGNIYNVPLVLTQIDYQNFISGQLGSGLNPAAFYYIDNINIPASDFSSPLDIIAPVVTLNGAAQVTVPLNNSYNEQGATAFDCHDGNLAVTIANPPDTSHVGVYDVLYIATDAAGNSDTAIRTVTVGTTPVADFSWSFPQLCNKAQFLDQSANIPTSYLWDFGDSTGSSQRNPAHIFGRNDTFTVCLTASNSFGNSAKVCKQVLITNCLGINDIDFSNQIAMFPNPTTGKVYVTLKEDLLPEFTLSATDVLGREIVAPAKYPSGTARAELNLLNMSNGVYFIKIQSKEGIAVKQLTVSHN